MNPIARLGEPLLYVGTQWGGKGRNLLELGDMFNVPKGIDISAEVCGTFMGRHGLDKIIPDIISSMSAEEAYEKIKESIFSCQLGNGVFSQILAEWERLNVIGSVRSTALDEDGDSRSFAGMGETVFGVSSAQELEAAIKECYASLFTPRAIVYRHQHTLPLQFGMGLVAQKLINADTAGVAFSALPGRRDTVHIESAFGLGKYVVDSNPSDIFTFTQGREAGIDATIATKPFRYHYDHSLRQVVRRQNSPTECDMPSLTDAQVREVAASTKTIERIYGKPMDIEFAYLGNVFYLLQARPITNLSSENTEIVLPEVNTSLIVAESRNIRNPGSYRGPVVILAEGDNNQFVVRQDAGQDGARLTLQQADERYQDGYILITPYTSPELEPMIRNSRVIVATQTGITGHAASLAVERDNIYLGAARVDDSLERIALGTVLDVAANSSRGIVYRE